MKMTKILCDNSVYKTIETCKYVYKKKKKKKNKEKKTKKKKKKKNTEVEKALTKKNRDFSGHKMWLDKIDKIIFVPCIFFPLPLFLSRSITRRLHNAQQQQERPPKEG